MDEKIIMDIESEISGVLLPDQMKILDGTLRKILGKYDAVEKEPPESFALVETENSIEQFLSAKKTEGCSARTTAYYKSVLEIFEKGIGKDVRLATTDSVRIFLSEHQKKTSCSSSTLDNIRRILSSFYGWLESEDRIVKSPMRRIHKIKSPQTIREPFTAENIEEMRSLLRNDSRRLAMIELMLSSGIRVGELVGLNRDSVNLEERSCIVYGKGAKEREVYFDARTKHVLQDYLEKRTDDNPALFVTKRASSETGKKERISINAVESMVRKIGRNLGIENAHPHRFRRTMATRALDKGMAIELVQFLLGHTKIDTTLRYAMVRQNNVRAAHRKYMC